jgi:hypothetical protein
MLFLSLTGLAILIFALSHGSLWVQRWQVKSKEEKERARQQKYHERYPNTQKRGPFAIPAHIHAVANKLEAYQRQQDRNERRRATREKLTIVGIFATALLALGQGWIFYGQLNAMREDQRAWIGPIYANIDNIPNDPSGAISATVPLRNTGHQPAISTIFIGNSENIDISDTAIHSVEIDYATRCLVTPKSENQSFVIFPSSNIPNDYIGHISVKKDKIDWGVVYGTKYLLIRGCAIYETVGKVAHTAFCYYAQAGVVGPGFLRLCDRGNEAD